MTRNLAKSIKKIALGAADVPQQCTVAMPDPQNEIRVWLHGLGEPLDVTHNHVIACASPLTVGLGVEIEPTSDDGPIPLTLRFREIGAEQRILAEITLCPSGCLSSPGQILSLFQIRRCRNYCLPRHRVWAHDLFQYCVRRRAEKNPEIPMSIRGSRAMNVLFICPRPVVLVSALHGESGNIFPMNLLGHVGTAHFAFALNSLRKAAPLVERAGRVALCSIPFEHAATARQLGKNHRRDSANWEELPFQTVPSPVFGFPLPQFTFRVREMEIEAVQKLGSHTLFLARVIRDQRLTESMQFCMIHGIYQARRTKSSRQLMQPLTHHVEA